MDGIEILRYSLECFYSLYFKTTVPNFLPHLLDKYMYMNHQVFFSYYFFKKILYQHLPFQFDTLVKCGENRLLG